MRRRTDLDGRVDVYTSLGSPRVDVDGIELGEEIHLADERSKHGAVEVFRGKPRSVIRQDPEAIPTPHVLPQVRCAGGYAAVDDHHLDPGARVFYHPLYGRWIVPQIAEEAQDVRHLRAHIPAVHIFGSAALVSDTRG